MKFMRNQGDKVRNSIIRRGGWLLALAAGAGLLLPGAASAQQSAAPAMAPYALQQQQAQAPTSPGPVQAGTTTIRLPLRQLIGAKEPMYLMTARSIYTVYVPFSARYRPRSCKLHLCFTNSIALLSERSTLRVILNDKVVAQYYLTRNQPDHVVDIEIPIKDLQVGSNQLQFIASQHYTLECEDPAAPELWTQILPDDSYFEAVVSLNNIYPKLSLLRNMIDPNLWSTYQYNVCFPGSANGSLTPSQLSWGSIISQGVGLNLDYRPMWVTTGGTLVAGVDNVVVGQMTDLTQYLTTTEMGSVNGSFIGLKQLPGDPTHFLLIITGRSEEEVGRAAYAFSLINFPLPDSQYALIDHFNFPSKEYWSRNAPLKDPGIYSFRQLGMEENKSIQGWNTDNARLEIYMPGDLSQDDGSNIELRLHFAYGAAFRQDSVLNVFVNHQFQYAIRMDDMRGAMHYGHRVYLPVKAFQPGRNLVEISPKMVPLMTDHCQMIQDENLWFTLYRDSDFVVPHLDKKARLPNFNLFSQTGFPYTGTPDGSDLALAVTGKDNTSVCAAWMLLGKMAQISGAVLYRAEVTFDAPPDRGKRDILFVGPIDTIPDDALSSSPISLSQMGRLRYLVQVSPSPEATAVGPIEELLEKLRGVPGVRSEREQPTTIEMAGVVANTLDDTVAVSYESPYGRARSATVITAHDSQTLYRGIFNLQDREYWDNLSGNLAVWNTTPQSLATARLGPEFLYKITNPIRRTENQFNSNPLLFVGVVFVTLGALAVLMRLLLRKREKKEE
jgi:hypothetical protein